MFDRGVARSLFACLTILATLGFGAAAHAVPADEAPVYAIDTYPFQKAPALQRWRSVLQREAHLTDRANPEACKDGKPPLACAAKEALELEDSLKDKTPAEQVAGVYAYFNAIKYKEHDPASCGIDCWKSRLQFLAQREGDCGDHALAEYFTLKRLGFEERNLQLIVAQLPGFEDSFKGGHVVLRVRADGDYYILDNRRTMLTDLSGLRVYKVLAGLNADSVQIYNLVTDQPPPGAVADASQYIASPGAQTAAAPVLVADAAGSASPASAPAAEEPAPLQTAEATTTPQSAPAPATVVAAATPAQQDDDTSTVCMQTASLADWNPFLPCTPVKSQKMVVKAKTIIGATPPTQIAEAPKAPEPKITQPEAPTPKASVSKPAEPKSAVAKVAVAVLAAQTAAAPKAAEPAAPQPKAAASKPAPVATAQTAKAEPADAESDSCIQGARLEDWNPDLPCAANGDASSLRIQFSD